MKIYMVYVNPLYGEEGDAKLYGVYSTPEKAEGARIEYMAGLKKDAGEPLNKDYFTYIDEAVLDERIVG